MLIEATTQTTLGNVFILTGEDDLNVAEGVTIECTYVDAEARSGADAVLAWVGTHKITVAGTIIGVDEAINLIGCVTAQTVQIAASGVLIGGGDGIVQDADGVLLDGIGSTLTNAGLINAYGSAVSMMVPDAGTTTIFNSGTMIGRVAGVWHKYGNGILEFTNTGTVTSPTIAFLGGGSADHVVNHGLMQGGIDLGYGDDSYFGHQGTVIGTIHGGAGDDLFGPGTHAEVIDGGDGIDTLDFSAATGKLIVSLTKASQNRGAEVAGDVYTGIENLIGGRFADRLSGTDDDNLLIGGARGDRLWGNGGDDTLIGGTAKDRLYGGSGADSFVFLTRKDGGDQIGDFVSGEDRIQLEGSAYGLGTYAGAITEQSFHSSAEGVAQDADHRFIFCTTNQTLWYDADGAGRGKAILIADLQTGATLTLADIQII